jgi:hypothetical protein
MRGASIRNPDNILHLLRHALRLGRGKVDFVDDRRYLQVMFNRQIGIGKSLRLYALGSVHNQHSAFTGGERT